MTDYASAEQHILKALHRDLPKKLTYHGTHHIADVLDAALRIAAAEKISEDETKLLRIAVLAHDWGFKEVYRGHEERGCIYVKNDLPKFGFDSSQISTICGMIMATRLPQEPHTQLERIIADADLDYLGRDDFYSIGKTLFNEFLEHGFVTDEKHWNEVQLKFLRNHRYHTNHCRNLREGEKQKRLKEIETLVTG